MKLDQDVAEALALYDTCTVLMRQRRSRAWHRESLHLMAYLDTFTPKQTSQYYMEVRKKLLRPRVFVKRKKRGKGTSASS